MSAFPLPPDASGITDTWARNCRHFQTPRWNDPTPSPTQWVVFHPRVRAISPARGETSQRAPQLGRGEWTVDAPLAPCFSRRMLRSLPALAAALLLTPLLAHAEAPKVPPGSPEDQALYSDAKRAQDAVVIERSGAARLLTRMKTFGHAERLRAAAASDGGEKAKAAAVRLTAAEAGARKALAGLEANANIHRACRRTLLSFGQAMAAKKESPGAAYLPRRRDEVRVCRDRLEALAGPARMANAELRAAMDEADAVAPRATAAVPAGKAN
jgi:hypothetical protein